MDDTTILGAALGQLGQTVKQAAKQVVKIPEEMAQDVGIQVGGAKPVASAENSGPLRSEASESKQKQWQSDEERVRFLKDLYGKSDMSKGGAVDSQDKSSSSASASANASAAKPEDQKELMELRDKLHREVYYDPIFNPVKKQEERPAEKVENEKKMEMQDLQQKEADKPQPIAVVREQNKAEQFRGASG